MKEIIVERAKTHRSSMAVLVDDDDYGWISRYNWSISTSTSTDIVYACRGATKEELIIGYPQSIVMHRQILELLQEPYIIVDHRNRNGLDNQKHNLRIATKSQNAINTGKMEGNYSSSYKGVSWSKSVNMWVAYINYNRRRRHLGIFTNEIDAAIAYNKSAKKLFGEFAYLNQIDT